MKKYKFIKNMDGIATAVFRQVDNTSIPFDPDNTDFSEFKRQINEDESQLQDADGNTMTAAEAKEFVATLP